MPRSAVLQAPFSNPCRPRRSVLFMPASNARALEKARTLAADTLVLDLEDAVAPDAKDVARRQAAEAIAAGAFGRREVAVRINGTDTDWWADDLRAVVSAGPDAILIPKVEDAGSVCLVADRMLRRGAPRSMALWAMLETPRAFLNADPIAASHPRLACLVVGTNDLSKGLQARQTVTREPVVTALGLAMLAARAHGHAILDGVYGAIDDANGLRAQCEQARDMGFDGKTLIHPSQIDTANTVFAPSRADVEDAGALIAAYDAAAEEGAGVATFRGRMIEALHVDDARRLIALSEAIAAL